jgi:regulator of protease activity HflC (stomatin/prohibitin superfamily)
MSLFIPATIVAGLAAGVYFGGPHVFPFAVIPFAERDLFATYISPGDGKMILRGNEFHDFHISMPGFHLNHPDAEYFTDKADPWEILPNEEGKTDDYYDVRPLWMRKFGFYPVGIPFQRKVNEEIFEWKQESGGEIIHRRELTRIFKVNAFPYAIIQREVISKDGLPMKLTYIVGLRIVNPYKALIRTEDWLVQLEAAIQQAVRNWASGFDFMELISQTDETGDAAQKEDFEKMVKAIAEEMHKRFGVVIDSADLKAPMPDGPEAQAYLDSIAAPFQAEQAAKVTVTAATAQAAAEEAVGMAQARVQDAQAKAAVAGEIARYEAAEKHAEGASAVIAGEALKGATVFAMPEGVSKLFGKIGEKL